MRDKALKGRNKSFAALHFRVVSCIVPPIQGWPVSPGFPGAALVPRSAPGWLGAEPSVLKTDSTNLMQRSIDSKRASNKRAGTPRESAPGRKTRRTQGRSPRRPFVRQLQLIIPPRTAFATEYPMPPFRSRRPTGLALFRPLCHLPPFERPKTGSFALSPRVV
jgi:hypothetical protein